MENYSLHSFHSVSFPFLEINAPKTSENDIELNKQYLHNQIDKLRGWHQHIDSKLVADILDLIVNDLYSLNKKFESKLK